MDNSKSLEQNFVQALLAINRVAARDILKREATEAANSLEQIMTGALQQIGDLWEKGQSSLAQVYMSGLICEELLQELLPQTAPMDALDPVAIVTFQDYHTLGKRIILSALKVHGFRVRDYGYGIQPQNLVEMLKRDNIRVLLLSTLMLPAALNVEKLRTMVDASGFKVKIIVGGAPFRFDKQLWRQVGADAMGYTASDAIALTKSMLEEEIS